LLYVTVGIRKTGASSTVGALGVPFGHIRFISRSNYGFLDTDMHINDTRGYHALAIDEHRNAFAPTLWRATANKVPDPNAWPKPRSVENTEQRWFVGAHANVGGGCTDDLLAQIPLRWLMTKAALHGLSFKNQVLIDEAKNTGPISNSYHEFAYGIYRFVSRPYQREIGAAPMEVSADQVSATINETIDASVFERWRSDASYRPASLVAWAKRQQVDPGALNTSVMARQASQSIIDEQPLPAIPAATAPAERETSMPGPNPTTTSGSPGSTDRH
jgi:hypothetical protein